MNTYAHIKHTCADKTDWDVWLQYFRHYPLNGT